MDTYLDLNPVNQPQRTQRTIAERLANDDVTAYATDSGCCNETNVQSRWARP